MPAFVSDDLKKLARDLKAADAQWGPAIRKRLNHATEFAQTVIRAALHNGRRASTTRAASTQTQARIRVGGPGKAGDTGWKEFGGMVVRHQAFGKPTVAYRLSIPRAPEGRAIYPAVQAKEQVITDDLALAVDDVLTAAGFTP